MEERPQHRKWIHNVKFRQKHACYGTGITGTSHGFL